ncbi:MAG: hypothetical protein A2Z77_01120 [Chloroflexi bacterium RBG_13_51_36]|nr:MAG: hypothetical protein A2Z77_01120 [Chloroflexi bacterium RBG_13_51_36]
MKQRLRAIFKGPVVFYPLLLAAFPILFLYAYNIRETSMGEVWLPLWVSVAGALVLWMVLTLILRSLAKGGLATAIFLLFFFSYGRLYGVLENSGIFTPEHAYVLPSMLFIWGYCVYFISRAERNFATATKVLNIIAVALIAINLFNIGSYKVRLAAVSADTSVETSVQASNSSAESTTLPDIYFIIMDEYASLSTIKEYYGYDNSGFANGLADSGFYIAHESRTHKAATEYSIASTLNMEWIGEEVPFDVVLQRIAHNDVAEFLRSKGYSFVHIGILDIDADLNYNFYASNEASAAVDEFLRIAWNTTMLSPFYTYIFGTQFEDFHRAAVMDSLELLKKMPEVQGPKFVYAHILCPHAPFVFGPSGGRIGTENIYDRVDKQVYLGQYIFITGEMERIIDELLEKSESHSIIILESDHGPRTLGKDAGTRIFNAVYLADNCSRYLYDSISSVNVFRLIFNCYFGGNYTLPSDDWEP